MLPRFLLLLSLLGPGNSLRGWDPREQRSQEASEPVRYRYRRQVTLDDELEDLEYSLEGTDPPEMLINVTTAVAAHPEPLTTMAMLDQSMVTGTGPAGPDAGGLSTESAAQWRSATVGMTDQPASTEAGTSQPVPTEAETSQPAPTEAETSQPAPMEAETSQPAPTEAKTSQPAPTEAKTSNPAPTEAGTSNPAPTEAETTQFPRSQVVKHLSIESSATETPSKEPTATETTSTETPSKEPTATETTSTETPSKEPTATETTSTEPIDSAVFLGPSATGHFNDNGLKKGLFVTPWSSLATTTPATSDLIPVKQCLLAILILASLATIFLVCTVVLAVRLSRKKHMYPVRNYSPTEMICISSLLPEGGEGAPVMANGDLPKVQDLKTELSEDHRDGDDLTLRSFLP